MSLLLGYIVVTAFLAVTAALVFAARPTSATNRAFAALLLLQAADNAAFEFMRESDSASDAIAWARLGDWYFFPRALVTVLLLVALFKSERFRAAQRALVAVSAAFTCALFAALLFAPDLVIDTSSPPRLSLGGYYVNAAWLSLAYATWLVLVNAIVLVVAARAAESPTRTTLQRRQAALVGLAFAVSAGWAAATRLTGALRAAAWPPVGNMAIDLLSLVALAAIVWALPRYARAFEGRARVAVFALASLAVAAGVFDLYGANARALGFPLPYDYVNSGFIWLVVFSLVTALALVRFGLAGFGERLAERVTLLAHTALAVAVIAIVASATLALSGGSSGALLVAVLVAAAALTLSTASLRAASRRLARLLLVERDDPAAFAERARLYAAALDAHAERTPGASEDTTLGELRRDLGLSDREHALLANAMRERRSAAASSPVLLGRYSVGRELGRGAFGSALLATDNASGRRVVLKRFHAAKAEKRALAEARALAAVRHPRVVPLVEVERVGEEVFLVLGFAEGGSAAALLAREAPLRPPRAAGIVLDLLEGLAALHAAGLVHRDVKPSNVLLDAQGRAMLGDFGSARFLSPEALDTTITGGDVLGSYGTVAPEVLAGAPAGPAADLYGAGAVLYRLLTNEHYVELAGKNAFQARQAILHDAPRLPHDRVPAALAAVIARALAKDPRGRYENAAEMRAALAEAARSLGVEEQERPADGDEVAVAESAPLPRIDRREVDA